MELVIAIIGIILALIFGINGIISYKKTKKVVSLAFENTGCFSLIRKDIGNLNIEMVYKGKNITNKLVYLKLKLKNNGTVDIDKNRIYSPLKVISLPEHKWLEANIKTSPTGVQTSTKIINPNCIQIDWDLLKQGEEIILETLIDKSNDDKIRDLDIYNNLKFDYRITDLGSLQFLEEATTFKKYLKTSLIKNINKSMWFFILIPGLYFLYSGYLPHFPLTCVKPQINYTLLNDTVENIGTLETSKENIIEIKFIDSNTTNALTLNDFKKKYKINKIESVGYLHDRLVAFTFMGWLYVSLGIILLILSLIFKTSDYIRK